jgi:hypothetical protein
MSERQVLGVLVTKTDDAMAYTVEGIALRTGLDADTVNRTLEGLEQLDPPLVRRDTNGEGRHWTAIDAAIADFEAPPTT